MVQEIKQRALSAPGFLKSSLVVNQPSVELVLPIVSLVEKRSYLLVKLYYIYVACSKGSAFTIIVKKKSVLFVVGINSTGQLYQAS